MASKSIYFLLVHVFPLKYLAALSGTADFHPYRQKNFLLWSVQSLFLLIMKLLTITLIGRYVLDLPVLVSGINGPNMTVEMSCNLCSGLAYYIGVQFRF